MQISVFRKAKLLLLTYRQFNSVFCLVNCFISLISYYLNKMSLNHVFLFKLELLVISKCFIFSFKINSLRILNNYHTYHFPHEYPQIHSSFPIFSKIAGFIIFFLNYVHIYGTVCHSVLLWRVHTEGRKVSNPLVLEL